MATDQIEVASVLALSADQIATIIMTAVNSEDQSSLLIEEPTSTTTEESLDQAVLGGGKRLRFTTQKMKSPWIVNQSLREQLKNILPVTKLIH